MEALKEFTIPLSGLKPGPHTYRYEADNEFFKHFENSAIQNGKFEILVTLDRRSDMVVLDFEVSGTFECNCDRCLAPIHLPIENEAQIILKFSDEPESNESTEELIYIDTHTHEWNAAEVMFDLIMLAMPLTNVYDCDGKPCNKEVLKKLDLLEQEGERDDSIWKDLKNITLN